MAEESIANRNTVNRDIRLNQKEKERIRARIPLIISMEKELTVDEFCSFLESNQKNYITKRLFTELEEKLHDLNGEEDLEQINKTAYYANLFSKLKIVGPVYLYRKAKISACILDSQKRTFRKKNPKIHDALNSIFRILNIIKSESIIVTKDHYKFMMKFIYDIKDIKDIKELIAKYPDFVNLKDDRGTPIICNLVDAFAKAIISKKVDRNLYLLTYYQSVIEIFLNSDTLIINEETKFLIEERLKEATMKVETLGDK